MSGFRLVAILCALVGLVLGVAPTGILAQQGIETRTLLDEQLEQLPGGPVCWDARRGSLAPGSSSPATGYHVHGWVVAYIIEGIERFEYEDGRTGEVGPGQAILFEADVPHRHASIGEVARSNVGFELTCEPQPNAIGNTGALPGIHEQPTAYQIQVRERTWQPGAQTPVHLLSGPTATLVLEGSIGRNTASGGVQCSGPGELYVSPVGELAQNTSAGPAPARTLDIDLWPAGEVRSQPQPAEIRLPTPYVEGACPEGR